MRRLKKNIAALLAAAVTATAAVTAAPPARAASLAWLSPLRPSVVTGPAVINGPAFRDTGGSPAKDAFTLLAALGIFRGPEGPLGPALPDAVVRRQDLAAIVIRMLNQEDLARALADYPLPYEDAADIPDWARGYANAAASRGILKGLPGSGDKVRFAGGEPVKFAEALAILTRAVGNEPATDAALGYPDRYVQYGAASRLSEGVEAAPDQEITREQMALLVANALRLGRWSSEKQRVVSGNTLLAARYGVTEGFVNEADPVRGRLYLQDAGGEDPARTMGSQVFVVGARDLQGLGGKRVRAVARDGVIVYIKVLADKE